MLSSGDTGSPTGRQLVLHSKGSLLTPKIHRTDLREKERESHLRASAVRNRTVDTTEVLAWPWPLERRQGSQNVDPQIRNLVRPLKLGSSSHQRSGREAMTCAFAHVLVMLSLIKSNLKLCCENTLVASKTRVGKHFLICTLARCHVQTKGVPI